MEKKNVYVRAQELLNKLPPVLQRVIERGRAEALDAELDEICAITWCLSRGR